MFFLEKTAPDAPEKLQNINKYKQICGQSAFIARAIKPVTGRKRFRCALKCKWLYYLYNTLLLHQPEIKIYNA